MPTQLLSIGVPFTILANVIYALPAAKCNMLLDLATALTFSNKSDFVTVVTPTANVVYTVAGGFVRSAADARVVLKRE